MSGKLCEESWRNPGRNLGRVQEESSEEWIENPLIGPGEFVGFSEKLSEE